MSIDQSAASSPGLRATLAPFQRPHHGRSIFEILVTAVPLIAAWGLALFAVRFGWWWGAILAIPAAGLLVRTFMIQHDCGHASFFRGKAANEWVGRVAGVFTLTPYDYWRRTHAQHHATSGNLDRRGLGAVETYTVAEYRALPWIKRIGYRLYRHPLVMFGLGPVYMFVLQQRLPIGLMKDAKAWLSVLGNGLGIIVLVAIQWAIAGPVGLLVVHLPIALIAGSIGVWLFYMQHQFEGAYWARNGEWERDEAAMHGSSNLVLPAPLRWMTANIGAHHLHHAGSRIPFYRLPEVMKRHPEFSQVSRITIADCRSAMKLRLWDEAAGKLVSFRDAARA